VIKIYSDTNILRYFGAAFSTRTVPGDLAVQLLLAPLVVLELLSQFGTDDAEDAFASIQALPRVHNPRASGVLPWSDEFFRICLFGLPPREDSFTPSLNRAVVTALNAESPAQLRQEGEEMRALLDQGKAEALQNFTNLRASMSAEGRLDGAQDRRIFAQSVARRAGVDPESVDVDSTVTHLDAHYRFEQQRITTAFNIPEYNAAKRANDLYDAELLIYLADPTLHLLTSDTGFKRAASSTQYSRIHIVRPDDLREPDRAIATLRQIVTAAEQK
jgi:hypothetical protein